MSIADSQADENQPMSLKVMRLTAPSLNLHSEHFLEFSGEGPEAIHLKAFPNFTEARYGLCELSPSLSVPSPLDTIYLGETFSSYICVNNETDDQLQHMTLKVELQATNRHFSLVDTTITPQNIKPHGSSQFIVHHEVKELGMHFLLCSVHYVTAAQERKFFKKIYKVNVLNPLAVKTKSNNLRIGGVILLEVQIQNLSNMNMFLDSLLFEPVDAFAFRDLNFVFSDSSQETRAHASKSKGDKKLAQVPEIDQDSSIDLEASITDPEISRNEPIDSLPDKKASDSSLTSVSEIPREIDISEESLMQTKENEVPVTSSSPSKEADIPKESESSQKSPAPETEGSRMSVFGAINCIKPMETRQYLYKLSPKDITVNDAYTSSELGKLDIVWRSSFCSIGRLQTSQLTRRPPLLEIVDIRVVSIPELILVEVPFPVMCRVQNRTREQMHLKLSADRTKVGSLLFSGVSPLDLGPIGPGHAFTFELEFMPLTPGPHKLGGLKIADLISKISHDIETLAEVFVQRHDHD